MHFTFVKVIIYNHKTLPTFHSQKYINAGQQTYCKMEIIVSSSLLEKTFQAFRSCLDTCPHCPGCRVKMTCQRQA